MVIGVDARVLQSDHVSGVEEYARRLLERMLPLDPAVRWVLVTAGARPLERAPWMGPARIVQAGPSSRLLWARTRLTGRPYLDRIAGGCDTFFFPHLILGATSPGVRRVATWHDLSWERMPELFTAGRRRWHDWYMDARGQARRADRIIAVSASTKDDLMDLYGIPESRIAVVHSGIDPALARADEGDLARWRARTGLHGRFILALGTREPRKNLEALVAAFERLHQAADALLVIAGPSGWLTGPLTRRIASSPARSRIRMVGPVPPADRGLWLSAASVLAYPSLLEGFGFPPLEAMTCGTPVVAAANSSLFETLGDAALLADPYHVPSLASALAEVLGSPRLAGELVRRGHERAAAFTWDRAAEATLRELVA